MQSRDDTRTLKRKVDAIITNINIYNRDIKKAMIKLKTNYDIDDIEDIDGIIEDLESEIKSIDKKKEVLLRQANKLLRDVTDA